MNQKKTPARTVNALLAKNLIKEENTFLLNEVVEQFSLSIPEDIIQLINPDDPDDPIAKQFVPSVEELNISAAEKADPIGDDKYRPVKGIVHRYPDRCLLLPLYVCPVYCRYCFRKEKLVKNKALTWPELEAAFNYINNHKELWEVILTGGDPLFMKAEAIAKIIKRLHQIKHIEIIRIHTRIPIIAPHRINEDMIAALKIKKPTYIVIHANHAKEFTVNATKACATLVDHGIPLLSQSVLLKGVNDRIEDLSDLMRCFVKNRIKPYYLHHADLVKGTKHFRTTIQHGQSLIKQLRGRFSGLCQPTYVLDIPGGYGKTAINPHYLQQNNNDEHNYGVEDYQGRIHFYDDA